MIFFLDHKTAEDSNHNHVFLYVFFFFFLRLVFLVFRLLYRVTVLLLINSEF